MFLLHPLALIILLLLPLSTPFPTTQDAPPPSPDTPTLTPAEQALSTRYTTALTTITTLCRTNAILILPNSSGASSPLHNSTDIAIVTELCALHAAYTAAALADNAGKEGVEKVNTERCKKRVGRDFKMEGFVFAVVFLSSGVAALLGRLGWLEWRAWKGRREGRAEGDEVMKEKKIKGIRERKEELFGKVGWGREGRMGIRRVGVVEDLKGTVNVNVRERRGSSVV